MSESPLPEGFVFDTNVYIAGWHVHYNPAVFPPVWELIDERFHDGRIVSPRAVYVELTQAHDDDLAAWAKARSSRFVDPDEDVQRLIALVHGAAPGLVKLGERNAADPWVVAFAHHLGFAVVTYEGIGPLGQPASGGGMNIPKACGAMGIECVLLGEALRRLGGPFTYQPSGVSPGSSP